MGMIETGQHDEIKKLYNSPANKRLKYCALAAILVSIALMLAMIIWIDRLSYKAILIMKGCAGIGAIIFVVLIGILIYRVNSKYIQQK